MKPKTVKKTEGKPKKEKSQSKRMKTFNSSQFSLWQQKCKGQQSSSVVDLINLKNQATAIRRAQNNSALSQYGSSKPVMMKTVVKKKKKGGSNKQKPKNNKNDIQQQFQKAKYKQSNSQSQIVFSNDQTKRQSYTIKDVKHIQSIEKDSNLVLRVNIKKEYIRKVEAATKIQKIFRGFMTRKILLKYIANQQQRLMNQIAVRSNNTDSEQFRQNQTHRTFADRQGEHLMNKLFQNQLDTNFNHTIRPRAQDFESQQDSGNQTDKQEQDQQKIESLLQVMQKQNKIHSQRKSWMQKQIENSGLSNGQSEQEEDDDTTNLIYRRQNPIYSQQEISQYLESSSDQSKQQEEQLDGYEPDIIFQTNQQYIQSRKSSLQNKNEPINKLSNRGITDLAVLLAGEDKIRKQLKQQPLAILSKKSEMYDLNDKQVQNKMKNEESKREKIQNNKQAKEQFKQEFITKTGNQQKKQQRNEEQTKNKQQLNQSKQKILNFQTIKTNKSRDSSPTIKQQSQKSNSNEKQSKQIKNIGDRMMFSPRRDIKYLDEDDCLSNQSNLSRSRPSVQHKQIIKLREIQCEKWDEVIKMVSEQIKKSQENNGEMVNFMKNIMQFSQKNKELLGSTRSVISQTEAFTTPTSIGIFKNDSIKDGSKSVQLPVSAQRQILQLQQDQRNDDYKFFKKKKPLKIDIIDSNFLKEQRQSLVVQKADCKMIKNNKFAFEINNEIFRKGKNLKDDNFKEINNKKEDMSKISQKVQHGKQIKQDFQQNFQNSKTLKKFLSSNIQVQDEAINDILKLRQQLLQKRESQELINLNNQLNKNQLSQQRFLQKLSALTRRFMQQKNAIDKAKQDIFKGYQAANNLMKDYFFDVRRMGIKLAVSKSQDNLKYKFSHPSSFVNDIKIDELTPKSTPKSNNTKNKKSIKQIFAQCEIEQIQQKKQQKSSNIIFNSIQSSQQSSLDFTQQQLKRFRKAANYDLQFNDLNKNMTTMSQEFIKQQKKFQQKEEEVSVFDQSPNSKIFNRSAVPQRQTYLLQQSKIPSARTPPHIQDIVQTEVNILCWQFAAELILRPDLSQKFLNKSSQIRPSQITQQQRSQFLNILEQNLPNRQNLHQKLNQNITPLPSQILKCMRLDFSDQAENQNDDQDAGYEQINRYQFVISQQSCAKSVMMFKNKLDQAQEKKEIQNIKTNNQLVKKFQQSIGSSNFILSQKVNKFVAQRQKFIRNKKQHTRQLRWEVLNIQLHCIFDSWNQQIIQLCSLRAGFSGIGLNQLTLSMINHNKPVGIDKCQSIVKGAKGKVLEILNDDSDINGKILRENFHQMCENDSSWIFYADEALSYGLQLVYLVQQQLYAEIAKELRRIIMKNSLSI